jgi:hypothetical protein
MSRIPSARIRFGRDRPGISGVVILGCLMLAHSGTAQLELQAETAVATEAAPERTGPEIVNRPPVTPEQLQQRVMEAGRLLAEQGYRLRDDSWHGELTPEIRVRIPVFLFQGNDYRFIIATDGPLRELLISVVNQDGEPQPHRTEFGGPPSTRAVSFAPQTSGLHYVQLGIAVGGGSHASCLGFAYR